MKSQGYATNGGVVRALTSAGESVSSAEESLSKGTDREEKVAPPHAKLENEVCLHRSASEDSLSRDSPSRFGYKPSKRKPAANNPRRGIRPKSSFNRSFNRSFNSSLNNRTKVSSSFSKHTINSVNSSLASVDMMDFGVDNYAVDYSMATLNEIEASMSRRNTICSSVESSYPSNGFLDWNHDDDSSDQVQPVVSGESSSLHNETKRCSSNDDHGEAEVPQAAQHRPSQRESWHIEDYDFEPAPAVKQNPIIPKVFKRLSSETVETVSSLISKLTFELGELPQGDQCDNSHEATTEEVKRAALLFSKQHSRRSTA